MNSKKIIQIVKWFPLILVAVYVMLYNPIQVKASTEQSQEVLPLEITKNQPFDDQARIITPVTRKLIFDLNQVYQSKTIKPEFYVVTYNSDEEDKKDLANNTNRIYKSLTNTFGPSDNYVLIVVANTKFGELPDSNLIQVKTTNPKLNDAKLKELINAEQNTTAPVSISSQVGNVLKRVAKEVNDGSDISFSNPKLNLIVMSKTEKKKSNKKDMIEIKISPYLGYVVLICLLLSLAPGIKAYGMFLIRKGYVRP